MSLFDPIDVIKEYVSYSSVSTDPEFKEGMQQARNFLCKLLKKLRLEVETVDTPLHPIILAKRKGPKEWPHVIIYGHYDVQPADPYELWDTNPFEPEIRNGRMYGRGTADNKGPLMVHMTAFANAIEKNPDLPLRVTFLIEGEEEIGSPSFKGFLETHREDLDADFVLLSDTCSQSPEQITITTGLRGIDCFEVCFEGPKMDLHSGIHGGAVRNPLQALIQVCSTLHNEDGSVNVPGFYDDVEEVLDWEKEELEKLNLAPETYKKFLGVDAFFPACGLNPFEAVRFSPTLEYNGVWGGYQGEGSKTIIPSKASAKISCRLVANQKAGQIKKLVKQAIIDRCPSGIKLKFVDQHSGPAYLVIPPDRPNTPMDQNVHLTTAFRAADKAISEVFGSAPVYLREGGSVPIIGDLKNILGLDSLMIGMFTPMDNLHAPNESFHLGMFENGVKASTKILEAIAQG